MPDMTLWNSHPRVYLPIEATGFAKCPYCSAEYILQRQTGQEEEAGDGSAAVAAVRPAVRPV
jgi:hypothetical protein